MMKKAIGLILVLLLVVVGNDAAAGAFGSSFGTLTTAKSIGLAKGTVGFGVGVAERTSCVGVFRYGISTFTDIRFKVGLADDNDGDTKPTFGADFKYQLLSYSQDGTTDLDIAFGGFAEYVDFGSTSALQIGGHVLGSCPIALQGGTTLSPYGRMNIRVENITWQEKNNDKIVDKSESNLKFGLNIGVC
ncbi:MAG: hypothetical protein U9R56_06120, partial [candidate division Zixibacteria bacterium]|nr:hypothetical protein [candidate division Zixibacteria bacterium]